MITSVLLLLYAAGVAVITLVCLLVAVCCFVSLMLMKRELDRR